MKKLGSAKANAILKRIIRDKLTTQEAFAIAEIVEGNVIRTIEDIIKSLNTFKKIKMGNRK